MKIKTLAVFCGSKKGKDPVYCAHAAELGRVLARNGIRLVYGGGGRGIMGALADAMMKQNGKVTGVIPAKLVEWEHQHEGISELIVTDDMHSRKKKMYEFCDAAMILPGGVGTMDEFFEMLTWNQLSIHDKLICILNSGGFYTHLIAHVVQLQEKGFLYEDLHARLKIFNDPDEFEKDILSNQ